MSSQAKPEILVHISAPSNASDDTRYRALAAAYLAYEPATRISLDGGGGGGDAHRNDSRGSDASLGPLPITTNSPQASQSAYDFFGPSQPVFFLNSPILSFQSAADNFSSPGLARTRDRPGPTAEPTSSWHTPASVVADSNPDNNISISQYRSPTRILEHYLQNRDPPESGSSPRQGDSSSKFSPTHEGSQLGFVSCSLDASKSSQDVPKPPQDGRGAPEDTWPSVILQSPLCDPSSSKPRSTSLPTAEPNDSCSSSPSQAPSVAVAPVRTWSQRVAELSRADSEPLPAKRHRGHPNREDGATALARSSSDFGPGRQQEESVRLGLSQGTREVWEGLQICSPEPPTSCRTLDGPALITPTLEKLANDLHIEKRYRPKVQTRDVRPFERGYWLLDCSTWKDSLKKTAWGFLANYVGTGVAGWGIWCTRDRDFTKIRLYCWGAVVGHMYLLLYLASVRNILYTGSTWVGADGGVVVTMGARSRTSK